MGSISRTPLSQSLYYVLIIQCRKLSKHASTFNIDLLITFSIIDKQSSSISEADIEHLIERAVPHVIHDLHLCLVDLAAEVVPAQLGHGEHRLLGGGLHLGPET